jgi:oxygen-dependent protoporphyrinogen oxidase
MIEPFVRNGARDEDTAWDFFVRRFGVEAASYLMGPFISGIYAGDPKLLGARAAFPKFHNFERDHGSMIIGAFRYMLAKRGHMKREGAKPKPGLFSFKGGLGALTATLAEKLGARLLLNTPVKAITLGDGAFSVTSTAGKWRGRVVISAVPPPQAASMLTALDDGIAPPLTAIPMSPVTLIHWSQDTAADIAPPGFGFLMPRLYDLRVLGTVFASQIFPGRAPQGQALLSSFYGGMLDSDAMELSDAEMRALLVREHSRIFGKPLAAPRMLRIARYPGAIPQLLPDHPERMALLRTALGRVPGLFMAGNYLSGVGVDLAVASGYSAAHEAQAFLGARTTMNSEAA